jgi:hypothetical protein
VDQTPFPRELGDSDKKSRLPFIQVEEPKELILSMRLLHTLQLQLSVQSTQLRNKSGFVGQTTKIEQQMALPDPSQHWDWK